MNDNEKSRNNRVIRTIILILVIIILLLLLKSCKKANDSKIVKEGITITEVKPSIKDFTNDTILINKKLKKDKEYAYNINIHNYLDNDYYLYKIEINNKDITFNKIIKLLKSNRDTKVRLVIKPSKRINKNFKVKFYYGKLNEIIIDKDVVSFYGEEKVSLPEAPKKEGYIFLGYSTKEGSNTVKYKPNVEYKIENGTRLYPVYKETSKKEDNNHNNNNQNNNNQNNNGGNQRSNSTPEEKKEDTPIVKNKYIITFEYQNGESSTTKEVTEGDTFGTLPTGYKRGYTFDGWYLDNTKITSDTIVNINNNVTLKARYNIINYSINYNLQGGTVSGNPGSYTVETNDITLNNPSKTGYTFTGWTGSNGDTPELLVKIEKGSTGSKSYKANYSQKAPVSYKVIHKIEELDGSFTVKETENFSAPSGTKVKPNVKTYEGFTSPNEVEVEVKEDGTTEVEYKYLRKSYNFSYGDTDNIDLDNSTEEGSYPFETEITVQAKTKEGYTFTKWSNGDTNNPITFELVDNINITPIYEAKKYQVIFDANTGEGSMSNQEMTYDVESILSENQFDKIGHRFIGWNTKADGTGTSYEDKATVKNLSTGEDITLYAQYIAETYTITFNTDGGEEIASKEITYGDTYGELPEANKVGYEFIGWYNLNNEKIESDTIVDVTSDITLTAKYNIITYQITYTLNGGSVTGNPESYTIEDTFTLINPSKRGYTFSGWTGSNGSSLQTSVTVVKGTTGDLNYEAHFEAGEATEYKVIHKKQKITLDGYVVEEEETLTGATDTKVTPQVKSYEGFTSPSAVEITIKGDGTSKVEYLYDRNIYSFSYSDVNEIDLDNSTEEGDYPYGTEITVKAKEKEGYTFTRWSNGETNNPATFTIGENLELSPIYEAKTYNIVFNANGGEGNMSNEEMTYDTSKALTKNTFTKVGYTFTGWNTKADGSGDSYLDEEEVNNLATSGSITLYAEWIANTNTGYKVRHNKQNITLDGYDLEEEENLTGTTDTMVTPSVKSYEGFTTPITQTVTISGDGSTVVNYNYTRNTYSYEITDTEDVISSLPEGTYPYGTEVTIEAKEKPGYTFDGWNDGETSNPIVITLDDNISITPIYEANTNTGYKVRHNKQNLTLDGYDLEEEENLTGTTDTMVTPSVKSYEGFTAPSTETVKISGDGSTVVNYNYTRNTYSYEITDTENVISSLPEGTYPYGTEITVSAKEKPGYTFDGWNDGNTDNPRTITISDNISVAPTYKANTNTGYKVRHNKQNITLDGYDLEEEESLTGTTDTKVTPNVKTYEGFTSPVPEEVTISGDGSTVVNYNYTRNSYRFELTDIEDVDSSLPNGTYPYGTEVTIEAKEKPGYTFEGWSDGNTDNPRTIVINGVTEISPVYTSNQDTRYTVIYKTMDLDGENYTVYETKVLTGETGTKVTPEVINITGFTKPSPIEITIKGDGTSKVEYLYERNKYNFTYSDTTNIDLNNSTPEGEYYYKTEITIKAKEKEGYTFTGWSNGETINPVTFNLNDDITITPTYSANTYNIVFNANGGEGSMSNEEMTYDTSKALTKNIFTKVGYTFAGWNTKADGSGDPYLDEEIVSNLATSGNIILYAEWAASEDTPYKVVHKYQNLDLTSYTEEVENLTGTTGVNVTPEIKGKIGFISPNAQTEAIKADGSLVITYIYDRETYTYEITDTENVISSLPEGTYPYGTEITVRAKEKEGYTFTGWSNGETSNPIVITLDDNISITPIYEANTNTGYKVRHNKQNLTLDGYDLEEEENLTGTTDTMVTPSVKSYEGFTAPSTETVKISGDGSTVVNYNYTRNTYSYEITDTENVISSLPEGTYPYGTEITVSAKEKPGYTFDGWNDGNTDNPRTITLSGNISIEPTYKANTNTPYTVVHKTMNLDGETYTVKETENLTGTTDTEVTPGVKTYTGFTSPNTQTVTIKGDGTTEVIYVYNRIIYTLSLEDTEYIVEGDLSGEYPYGTELTLTAKDRENYVFDRWSNNSTVNPTILTITGNQTVKPIYISNSYTVTFNANGGTGSMNDQSITKNVKTSLTTNEFTKSGSIFDSWNTEIDGSGTSYYDGEEVLNITDGDSITLYAIWAPSDKVARIGNIYYTKLATAISNVPTTGEETEIVLLQDTAEKAEIPTTKNVVIDLQNHTLSNNGNLNVVVNNGTLKLLNGTITTDVAQGAINNNSTGTMVVDGTNIIVSKSTSRQALYNDGGTLTLNNVYFSSESTIRATLHNLNNGSINLNNGTIISTSIYAIYNEKGTLNIGVKDGNIKDSPVIQGKTYGIIANNTYNFYDGIIKGSTYHAGKTSNTGNTPSISNDVDETKITEIEEDSEYLRGEETIGSYTYKTLTLNRQYTVTFEANGGETSESSRKVTEGSPIGELPTATKGDQVLEGWYTNLTDGVKITEETIINNDVTFFAKYRDKKAIFDTGKNVNVKMKNLAGTTTSGTTPYNTNDTNVTSILRSLTQPDLTQMTDDNIVSSEESDVPIYSWYDNGTIYWWSEANIEYLNEDASYMFANFKSAEEIDVSYDTRNVTNMSNMFNADSSIVSLDLSSFDTSNVNNMSGMFIGNTNLTSLNFGDSFDTSKVTDMSNMFINCINLTSLNVNSFDTRNVTNMTYMFMGCSGLESLNLSSFNTSKVTNMSNMFYNCLNLKSIDVSIFDTSNVIDMSNMFMHCDKLKTLDLSTFNTSNVVNLNCFVAAKGLVELNLSNLDLRKFVENGGTPNLVNLSAGGLNSLKILNVSNAKFGANMNYQFGGFPSLERIIMNNVDTSIVTDMSSMFSNDSNLIELDLSDFDTSNVTNMSSMFENMTNLETIYVSDDFVTTSVTESNDMFKGSVNLVGGLGTIYDENHIDKEYAHYDEGVTNPGYFTDANGQRFTVTFNANGGTVGEPERLVVPYHKIGKLPRPTKEELGFDGWYTDLTDGTKITEDTIINNDVTFYAKYRNPMAIFDTGKNVNVKFKNLAGTTTSGTTPYNTNDTNVTSILRSLTQPDLTQMTDDNIVSSEESDVPIYSWYDNGTIYWWSEANIEYLNEDASYMFAHFMSAEEIDVSYDTSEVTNMSNMFNGDSSIVSLDLSCFDTSNVTDMSNMFINCINLTSLNVNSFDTSNVTNMTAMFSNCSSLTTLDLGSKFDTSNVTNMYSMFSGCSSLTTLDLGSKFDTSNVTNMTAMFSNCSSLTALDLSSFDTSNVTGMNAIIGGCTSLETINLSGFDFRKFNPGSLFMNLTSGGLKSLKTIILDEAILPANMSYGFGGLSSVETISLNNVDTTNVTNMNSLFNNDTNLVSLDLSSFDTSNVTDMGTMFYNNKSLVILVLTSFDTSKVTNMSSMFVSCNNLTTIYTSDNFVLDNVISDSGMFYDCVSLVGGMGTVYDVNHIDSLYAHYDEGETNPGYFTDKTNANLYTITFDENGGNLSGNNTRIIPQGTKIGKLPIPTREGYGFVGWYTGLTDGVEINEHYVPTSNDTYYAIWGTKYATFDIGQNVAGKFKKLSGTSTYASYSANDSNVTSIQKATTIPDLSTMTEDNIVSSPSSLLPIYAWYDNGTIYWWSESEKDYMNYDSSYMFYNFSKLANLDTAKLEAKNISNASYMFQNDSSLETLNLSIWNTENASNMAYMFFNCSGLTNLNISNLNTRNVKNMSYMFENCSSLTSINVKSFNTINVTTMHEMFYNCSNLESIDVSNFNTSKVTDMGYMFQNCNKLTTLDLSNFDTSKVTNLSGIVACKGLETLNVSNFDLRRYYDTTNNYNFMSLSAGGLPKIKSINMSNAKFGASMSYQFGGLSTLEEIDLTNVDTSLTTDMGALFNGDSKLTELDLSDFDTSKVTTLGSVIYGCSSLTSLDLSNWDLRKYNSSSFMLSGIGVSSTPLKTIILDNSILSPNMNYGFGGLNNVETLSLSNVDTSNVIDMSSLFQNSTGLIELDLSDFDTSNVTNMSAMFLGTNLTSLDLKSFNTSKVTNMSAMFYNSSNLTELDLSSFDTSNVTDMGGMFNNCTNLEELDLNNFNTFNVTDMGGMFYKSSSLTELDLSSFDTSKVTNMGNMFREMSSLTTIIVSDDFVTNNVETSTDMFTDSVNLVGGDGTTYDPDHVDIEYAHYDEGVTNPGYFNAIDRSNIYTVTFIDNDIVYRHRYVTKGEKIGSFPEMFKLGYTFDGWYLNNTKINEDYIPTEDITVYSNWIHTEYSIDFDSQGGWEVNSYTRYYDDLLGELPITERPGYAFRGWYTNTNYTTQIDENTLVKGNVTYYAKWNKIYTITFDPNGGTVSPTTKDVVDTEKLGELPIPVKENNSFAGWYTGITDGTEVNENTIVNSNTKYYAHWVPIYTVTYNSNDGTFENDENTNTVRYDYSKTNVTKYSHTPNINDEGVASSVYTNNLIQNDIVTIPGAESLNIEVWYLTESASSDWLAIYPEGIKPTINNYSSATISNGKLGGHGNYTGYIKPSDTDTTYHRTFTVQGDTAQFYFKSDGYGAYYGYYAIITANGYKYNSLGDYKIPEKTNSKFNSWNTESDGSGISYYSEEEVEYAITERKSNLTLYAKYTDEVVVTYDANGGSFENDELTNNVNYEYTTSKVTKYSHTPNINDSGVASGTYANNLSINDVVTIPGAESLFIEVWYSTQGTSYDWLAIYPAGVTPTSSNYSSATISNGKLGGGTSSKKPSDNSSYHRVFVVNGDTAQFYFKSNASTGYYGYYAKITANSTNYTSKGGYKTPEKENSGLCEWNTKADGTGTSYYSEKEIDNLVKENKSNLTLYAIYKDNINVTYDANGGTFDNSESTNSIIYEYTTGTVTKYSHTPNIDDSGVASGVYANNLSVNDVVTIPGVTALNIEVWFSIESASYDWLAIYPAGITPTLSNYSQATISGGKLAGHGSYSGYTKPADTDTTYHRTFTVQGDTAQFYFKSNVSGAYYGYYAIVTGTQTYVGQSEYKEPYKTAKKLIGWNTSSDGTGTSYLNENEIISNFANMNTPTTLYAQYVDAVATFDTGKNVNVKFKKLSGQTSTSYLAENTAITSIQKSTTAPNISQMTNDNIVSTSTSDVPIYAWYDNGTIYWWSEDNIPSLNQDSSSMFRYFQGLTNIDLSSFDTSKVTDMSQMFSGCNNLTTLDLSSFDTSKVTDMSGMFSSMLSNPMKLTTIIGLENFDTSKVTNMRSMFYGCSSLSSLDLGDKFDTSKVTNMSGMFGECSSLPSLDLSSFDTSNVTSMNSMFNNCSSLTILELGDNFNTSHVTEMSQMFSNCSSLTTLDLGDKFDTSSVTTMYRMFINCNMLTTLELGDKFDTSKVTDMSDMFRSCSSLPSLDLGDKFDTSSVTTMHQMFYNCSSLTTLELGDKFDTSKVTDMSYMFSSNFLYNPMKLTTINLGDNFDTGNVTNMKSMFYGCSSLPSLDLGDKFDTRNVTNMSFMFDDCKSLTTLELGDNFDTNKVTNMEGMFSDCYSLTTLDLGDKFDTSNVRNMGAMFFSCSSLTTLDLSNFSTSNVTNMYEMFSGCNNLTTIYASSSFVTTNVTDSANMFTNDTNLVGGAGTVYNSSYEDATYAHIDGGTSNPGYFTDKAAIPITFDKNSSTATGSMNNQMINPNVEAKLVANTYTNPGYKFTGWNTKSDGTGTSYSDGDSITITTDTTLYAQWIEMNAVFNTGSSVNVKLKKLSGQTSATYNTSNTSITSIQKSNKSPNISTMTNDNIVSTSTSVVPIYAWYDNGTIYWWSEDNTPSLNQDSSSMFRYFQGLTNIDLSSFDTSNVTNMSYMFYYTSIDNLDLGDNFDTSSVTTMYRMFEECYFDSLDLGDKFDTSKVTDMSRMFYETSVDNLDLGDKFDTSKVTDMSSMFYAAIVDNLDLGDKFDTSKVKNMSNMFNQFLSKSGSLDLGDNFNTINVTNMSSMFLHTYVSNLDLGDKFDTSNVTNMSYMFYNCINLTSLDLGNKFDTSSVTTMSHMFGYSKKITSLDLGDNFDTGKVTDMSYMFQHCSNLTTLNLGDKFDTSSVTNMNGMFDNCSSLITLDLSDFDTRNVTNMSKMFYNCINLTSLDLGNKFDTSKVTTMSYMFGYSKKITSLDLGDNFDTGKVTDMSYMFQHCINLTTLNLGDKFDTSNVITMNNMFASCDILITIDLGDKFDTSNVTNMSYMFGYSKKITSLDLGDKFDTSKVTTMYGMFFECRSLTTLDLGDKFDTSNVTSMEDIFSGCSSLTTLDLSDFDTSNVTNMNRMFYINSKIKTIYVSTNFVTTNVTSSTSMLLDCYNIVGGQGTVYDPDNIRGAYAHIDGGPSNPGYFTDINSTITFDSNGGSGSMDNQTINNRVGGTLSTNTFTRSNYTFVGWNTKTDGTGTSFNDEEVIAKYGLKGNYTLYAMWRYDGAAEEGEPVKSHTTDDETCGDTTPPTCVLNYVSNISNGFGYSFSCTDDIRINRITSLFDHDPYSGQYDSSTFDSIGTIKDGTISNEGKTSSYTSQWTTYSANGPEKGTCYYFSYGAEDSCGNWNVYHTSRCFQY